MRRVSVVLSPSEIDPERIAGANVVVIDVLLATTSMLTILDRGAHRVFPAPDLEAARTLRQRLSSRKVITGGELNMSLIDGFDRGPLPCEYTSENVAGSDVVFLTTNGTRTLGRVTSARGLFMGCLRNADAVAEHLLRQEPSDAVLVCAGSQGRFALEDLVGAGAMVDRLTDADPHLNDAAILAREYFHGCSRDLLSALRQGRVGRAIEEEGHLDCLRHAATLNVSSRVPLVSTDDMLVTKG